MKTNEKSGMRQKSLKHGLLVTVSVLFLSVQSLFSQVDFGVTLGGGYGKITHQFTRSGQNTSFSYPAPALYVSGEMGFNRFYLDLSLALLFSSSNPTLGNEKIDLSGYKSSIGFDFTTGLGYLYHITKKFEAGGEIGLHVSSFTITPSDLSDLNKLRFGGNYGVIGVAALPRIRYSLSEKIKLSLTIPIGYDFGAMSEDVVVGGTSVGKSPAIVQPASLVPRFKGTTLGAYFSVGFFFGV